MASHLRRPSCFLTLCLMGMATQCISSASAQLRSAQAPACRVEQLKISRPTGPDGGADHAAFVFQVQNTSQQSCTVSGVPHLRFLNRKNEAVSMPVCANCVDYLFAAKMSKPVTLLPDQSAYFLIGLLNGSVPGVVCRQLFRMEIVLPSGTRPLSFNFPVHWPVCDLDVTAWQPGDYRNVHSR